jgi:hypothetical protein
MKTFLKYFAIPALCNLLICSPALAKKKDDSDESKKKDGDSSAGTVPGAGQFPAPQSGGKSSNGRGGQKQANVPSKKSVTPNVPNPEPKSSRKKASKDKDPEAGRTPKPPAPTPAAPKKKTVKPDGGDTHPPSSNKRKDDEKGKSDGSADKHKNPDKTPNTDKPDKGDTGGKGGKDKSDAGDADRKGDKDKQGPGDSAGTSSKDRSDKGDSSGKDTKNKPDKGDSASKDTKNKSDKDKDDGERKPMALPGKRPTVPGSDQKQVGKRPADATPMKKGDPRIAENTRKPEPLKKVVVRPGQNSKTVKRPDIDNSTTKKWWNSGNTINSNNKTVNIKVNNNYRQNVNWSTQRHNWGYSPWWNRPVVRPWYASSWNCRWRPSYYRYHYPYYPRYVGYRPPGYAVVPAIGWGLIGWSLGTMIYDTGYRTYHNPYHARPVRAHRGGQVTYTQPITRVAVDSAPEDDAQVEELTRKSESFVAESQAAFKQDNYLVALELAEKAIEESPGDGALHEYRALVLFALGQYGEAAGVLNPVLASGPGWDWATMVALYDSQQTYTDQLQKLEAYSEQKPDAADTHFLLGYHYMVCGHLDLAAPQFDLAAKLMPADSVSKELAELCRSSTNSTDEKDAPDAEEAAPADAPVPEPVPLEKLTGIWVSNRDAGDSITLTFKDDGTFTWSYLNEGKTTTMAGEYSINDNGLLVLDSKDSQMVASVALPESSQMKFVLAGGPPEDAGLAFKKN